MSGSLQILVCLSLLTFAACESGSQKQVRPKSAISNADATEGAGTSDVGKIKKSVDKKIPVNSDSIVYLSHAEGFSFCGYTETFQLDGLNLTHIKTTNSSNDTCVTQTLNPARVLTESQRADFLKLIGNFSFNTIGETCGTDEDVQQLRIVSGTQDDSYWVRPCKKNSPNLADDTFSAIWKAAESLAKN